MPAASVLASKPPKPPPREPDEPAPGRRLDDPAAARTAIYAKALTAAQELPPVSDAGLTLRLANPHYVDGPDFGPKKVKEAQLKGETLGRRMRGTWELVEDASGQVLDRNTQVVARVPWLSDRGYYLHRGSHYAVRNQTRLLGGAYARFKADGEPEVHVQAEPGKGLTHHLELDRAKSLLKFRVGEASAPLVPVLKAAGASDEEIQATLGPDFYAANSRYEPAATARLRQSVFRRHDATDADLAARLTATELTPHVSARTLGKPYARMDKDALLAATSRLLAVSKGEAEEDDRDDPSNQRFLGPEDLFAERLTKDHAKVRLQALRKAGRERSLARLPSGLLTPQLEHVLLHSGLGSTPEEVNPLESFDRLSQVTRMGEGGVGSVDAIPDSAREVRPTQFGFWDPIRTSEGLAVGADGYVASAARKGDDGRLYAAFRDRTGRKVWRSPDQLHDLTVAWPGHERWPYDKVPATRDGKIVYAGRHELDLTPEHFEGYFSPLANLTPFKSAARNHRLAMASRMATQALPLVEPEAPLVQNAVPGSDRTTSYDDVLGGQAGAVRAAKKGTVEAVSEDAITLRHADGKTSTVELHRHHPHNRKSFLHQTPTVQAGDLVEPGQLLAKSNYTDHQGTLALGRNLSTAYLPYKGLTYEDAVAVSESAAKLMTSEHAYRHELGPDPKLHTGLARYLGFFPGKHDRATLAKLDKDGVIRPGQEVKQGDPLVLAFREAEQSGARIHRKGQKTYADASLLWDHDDPGTVLDVVQGRNGPMVVVKSQSALKVGDKVAGRYGNKGVVAKVIPDEQMPRGEDGRPYHVLVGPDAITTRGNPAQKAELALARVARLTGQPYKVEDFADIDDVSAYAKGELAKHGLQPHETATDPETGRGIKRVPSGELYWMKLTHQAESKENARAGGSYDVDEAPAKGGYGGAKRMGLLSVNALLSHGATELLAEEGIRGARNDDYWMQLLQGHTPREPDEPHVYRQFLARLTAAGANPVRHGHRLHFKALTADDIDRLAGDRRVVNGDTVKSLDLEPVKGGLFDQAATGGHGGLQWSSIQLPEAMPSPVMEEPLRRLLGLTKDGFEQVLSGQKELPGYGSGPPALAKALKKVDLQTELRDARAGLGASSASARDAARRKLDDVKGMLRQGVHPSDLLWSHAPVLPPRFRAVSRLPTGQPIIPDANYLYSDLLRAGENYKAVAAQAGTQNAGPERLAVYHALKAVAGLGDPVGRKSREKEVSGLLAKVFGGAPKTGTLQRQLLGTTVDNVGRGVIVPNPDLDMDQIGLPEDLAFTTYGRHLAGRLARKGMAPLAALKAVEERSPEARTALLEEMAERPVFADRAPVWHKYGTLGFHPVLVPGRAVHVSPLVTAGFNADFDGDTMQVHAPATDAGVRRVLAMRPSQNLISAADFKTPMFAPGKLFLGGLHHASTAKSDRRVQVFATTADVRKALAAGDLDASDPVEVIKPD